MSIFANRKAHFTSDGPDKSLKKWQFCEKLTSMPPKAAAEKHSGTSCETCQVTKVILFTIF